MSLGRRLLLHGGRAGKPGAWSLLQVDAGISCTLQRRASLLALLAPERKRAGEFPWHNFNNENQRMNHNLVTTGT